MNIDKLLLIIECILGGLFSMVVLILIAWVVR